MDSHGPMAAEALRQRPRPRTPVPETPSQINQRFSASMTIAINGPRVWDRIAGKDDPGPVIESITIPLSIGEDGIRWNSEVIANGLAAIYKRWREDRDAQEIKEILKNYSADELREAVALYEQSRIDTEIRKCCRDIMTGHAGKCPACRQEWEIVGTQWRKVAHGHS